MPGGVAGAAAKIAVPLCRCGIRFADFGQTGWPSDDPVKVRVHPWRNRLARNMLSVGT